MAAVELERLIDRPTLAVVAALRNKDEEKIFNDILTGIRIVDVDGFGRETGINAELRSFSPRLLPPSKLQISPRRDLLCYFICT
jgi:hypothetical protein